MKEYRKMYLEIIQIITTTKSKFIKRKFYLQTTKYSVNLNTKETIILSVSEDEGINGNLIKMTKGEEKNKPYWDNANKIKCTTLELRTLLEQLKFKFNEK